MNKHEWKGAEGKNFLPNKKSPSALEGNYIFCQCPGRISLFFEKEHQNKTDRYLRSKYTEKERSIFKQKKKNKKKTRGQNKL